MGAPTTTKIYTAIVLDFETGGLDPTKHGATQIAMHCIRLDTFEIVDKYQSYIKPYNFVDVLPKKKIVRKKKSDAEDAERLMEYDWDMMKKYTGITRELLMEEGQELHEVVAQMREFAIKSKLSPGKDTLPIIVGQNIGFDIGFMHQIFAFTKEKMKGAFAGSDGFFGFEPCRLDTIDLARMTFANDKSVTSYKLGIIAEKLGIDLFDAHDADADVEATGDIYRVCGMRMRNDEIYLGAQKTKTREHFKF